MEQTQNTQSYDLGFHQASIKLEPYEPFGFRNKEDTNAGRFFFINRKQDRFTLTCNYREHGVNKNGKKYGRFKKLFSFTVTLREPKTVGSMSLNVFYHGNVGGHKYQLLNITRNPSIVLGSFPSELNSYIVEEILQLVKRQNIFDNERYIKIAHKTREALAVKSFSSEVAIKLISHVAFPILDNPLNVNKNVLQLVNLKVEQNNFETLIPPLFVMPLIRQRNLDDLVDALKIAPENVSFFKENISKWNVDALYYMLIAKGFMSAASQRKLLDVFVNDSNHEFFVTAHSFDEHLTGMYISRLRQVLKTVNKQSREKVLLDAKFVSYFSRLIKLWVGRSKFEKTVKISKNVTNVEELYNELIEELNDRKTLLHDVKKGEVSTLLDNLNDGIIFESDDSFYKSLVGSFGRMNLWLPVKMEDTGVYHTWFYYGEVNRESPLWKPIFCDELFISSSFEASGFNKRVRHATDDVQILFSPKMYVKFLTTLNDLASKEMTRHGITDTKTNRSFVSLVILMFYSYINYRKYSPIPRKIFTLYKAGLNPSIIEYAVKHKLSANVVKEYAGLPLEWVEKLMGAKENTFVKTVDAF